MGGTQNVTDTWMCKWVVKWCIWLHIPTFPVLSLLYNYAKGTPMLSGYQVSVTASVICLEIVNWSKRPSRWSAWTWISALWRIFLAPILIRSFFFRKCTLCWTYCSPLKIQYIAVTQDLCYKSNLFAFNQDLKVPTADVLFLPKDINGTSLIL